MGIENNSLFALTVLACNQGDARQCFNAGTISKTEGDYDSAIKFYNKSCDANDSKGCNNLAYLYLEGKGVKRNIKIAKKFSNKACSLGNNIACLNLGKLYYSNKGGLGRDLNKSLSFFEIACKNGNMEGCYNVGAIYGYDRPLSKEENIKRSFIFLDKACKGKYGKACLAIKPICEALCNKGDASACFELGSIYSRGIGIKRDRKKAKEILMKSCKLGLQKSCLAVMLLENYGNK